MAEKIYHDRRRVNGDYGRNLALVETYDVSTDRWARVGSPHCAEGITVAVVEGKIYVMGGDGSNGTFNENGGPTPGGSFSDMNEVFTSLSGALSRFFTMFCYDTALLL